MKSSSIKEKAIEYRNIGYSYEKIGKELNISKQNAYNLINKKPILTQEKVLGKIKYKRIRDWLCENNVRFIDFCIMCDKSNSMHIKAWSDSKSGRFLCGLSKGDIYVIKEILFHTGLTFEEVFEI